VRKLALLVLLSSALCWAQSAADEYPINVHVSASQWVIVPSGIGPLVAQKISVVITGKKYELEADAKGKVTLLALGDYKARLIEDIHKDAYESSQTYELQFSDKKTRKFIMVGQSE